MQQKTRQQMSAAVRVRFRVRFENGNVSISDEFSSEPHGEGKEAYLYPSTDRVRFSALPSTASIGLVVSTALDWFRVRFRRPLKSKRVRDPRAKQYSDSALRKIRAPIKIKSALPPPPTQKGGILRTWFFLQKEGIFPGVHKIGAAISGPRIADTNFTATKRIFLKQMFIGANSGTPTAHFQRQ